MQKNIIKNTSMLYMMNTAKIVFPLITLPYLTRVLTVDYYGVVSYVKAVMQYMQIIVDFGFILSGTRDIVLVRNNKDRMNYEVGNILLAKLILSCVAFCALGIAIAGISILRQHLLFTILSFVAVFLTNFLFDFLFRGIEKMEIITIRFVLMKGVAALFTFIFVKNDSNILWIPILDIIGTAFAILLVHIELNKLGIKVKIEGVMKAWYKIKDSSIYFFSNMATTAFMAFNTILIGIFIEKAEVAYWSLCLQMITAVQSFYTPLTEGIYPYMIKSKDISILRNAIKIYMPIVIMGCIFTLIFAEHALLIIGGMQYVEAAPVLRFLVVVLFFSFPSMLLGWPALGAIGKHKETTNTTIITAFVQIVGLIILLYTKQFSLINIALLRGLTEALLFILRFFYYYRFRIEFNTPVKKRLEKNPIALKR